MSRGGVEDRPGMGEDKHGYPCGDEIVCYHPEYELAEGKWSYKKDFFCAFGDTKEGAYNV